MEYFGNSREFFMVSKLTNLNLKRLTIFDNNYFAIIWFRSDLNVISIDDSLKIFMRNELLFLTEISKINIEESCNARVIVFNGLFGGCLKNDAMANFKNNIFSTGKGGLKAIKITDNLINEFELLWRLFQIEIHTNNYLKLGMLQGLLNNFLILCLRIFKLNKALLIDSGELSLIKKYIHLVDQFFRTKHTVTEYATLLNKSPKTLSNLFSKEGVKSPLKYINERKMNEAKRLLYFSDKSIQEIAYSIGYESTKSFSRFFKNQEGISPYCYRIRKKGKKEC
ncbi:helix-turn-helix domain-containing protein [Pontimicrobium aquaticum]|uniref:Helix-turn-helix transcriptional regulator n=1 Tax=Pontimicrobium aquaticum TaxID=2565367 RepID=A0A4U0ESG8_9FLAO|nr:AraC family transcriptional regulator [Pontimicrobium aquaticum]TJY34671.1 helix-turn-helix transcriptional regulator [Pontimicrobium aquaticum]